MHSLFIYTSSGTTKDHSATLSWSLGKTIWKQVSDSKLFSKNRDDSKVFLAHILEKYIINSYCVFIF